MINTKFRNVDVSGDWWENNNREGEWGLQSSRKVLFRKLDGGYTGVYFLLVCLPYIYIMYFVLIRNFIFKNPGKPKHKTLGLKENAH